MYGIRADLSFLVGRRLESVEATGFQVELTISGGVAIAVESLIERRGQRLLAEPPRRFLELSGREITGVEVIEARRLRLVLDGEDPLDIVDSLEAFESFTITGPNLFLVV